MLQLITVGIGSIKILTLEKDELTNCTQEDLTYETIEFKRKKKYKWNLVVLLFAQNAR